MHDLRFTQHAETRMRQRGFRNADVDLVLSVATRVADDAFFLSDRDAAREIGRCRRKIQQLERQWGGMGRIDYGDVGARSSNSNACEAPSS